MVKLSISKHGFELGSIIINLKTSEIGDISISLKHHNNPEKVLSTENVSTIKIKSQNKVPSS